MTFVVDLCGVKESINFELDQLNGLDVIKYVANNTENGKRLFIGIAGGPGSGKTLFSKLLSKYLADRLNIKSVCISADGYHFTNETLIKNNLRQQKGLPQSMDDEALYADIFKLKHQQPFQSVHLPVYDREIHDPIPNAIEIKHDVQVIVIEGLYMLYWTEIAKLLDYVSFMDATSEETRKRLEERKIKCGSTLKEAQKSYKNIDSKTIALTTATRSRANSIIRTDFSRNGNIEYEQIKLKSNL